MDYLSDKLDKNRFKKFAGDAVKKMTDGELATLVCFESEAVERLGIHRYNWWNEASHGVARSGIATVFPCPTALASSFDRWVVREVAEAVADEARAKYNMYAERGEYDIYKGLTFWCPNVNIFRDPRWGRGQETFGEDPYLTSELGVNYIEGLQSGGGEFGGYMKVAACAKHFAVHSGPEKLRHEFDAVVSEKDLRETYLPAFKAAVDCGVAGVMGAYNRTDGEPCCVSKKLTEILFGEWGFDGYFMSDSYALNNVHEGHKYTKDAVETCAAALNAGLVLDCAHIYRDYIKEALERGLVTRDTLERAAAKTLEIRARLGEFDALRPFSDIPWETVDSPAMRRINLRVAERSLVLLENDGALPVDKTKVKRIAVVGPVADSRDALVGNYNGHPTEYYTVLKGIRRVFKGADVRFAEGSQMILEDSNRVYGFGDMISEGVAEAKAADLTILCLGLDATLEGEESQVENEVISGGDRKTVGLPSTQKRLLREVLDASDNVIVVTFCGGCIDIGDDARRRAKAHIHAWYPGALGGLAIARAIAGEAEFSGRTPVTFYREEAKLPEFTDYSMEKRTRRSDPETVLYPFGYGLAYNNYEVVKVEEKASFDFVKYVNVTVKNLSEKRLRRVICLYTDKGEADLPERSFALCAAEPVDLGGGEEKEIEISVSSEWFLPYGDDGRQFVPKEKIRFIAK